MKNKTPRERKKPRTDTLTNGAPRGYTNRRRVTELIHEFCERVKLGAQREKEER